jgi:hypothetical protein
MPTRIPFVLLAAALACSVFAAPAHALRARVYVSKAGADAGACSFSAPCQSLSFALSAVEPGGEITILDSGGYNPITITQGVTITVPQGVEAGIVAAAGGNAITINTADSSSVVSLHGLTLDGAGSGQNGIVLNNTGSLEIIDVVVRNFTNDGIELIPVDSQNNASTNFLISKVIASHNGNAGIYYNPQVQCVGINAVIDRAITTNNAYGMSFTSYDCGNLSSLAISNSIASNNSNTGMLFNATGQSMIGTIDTSNINNNNIGISTTGQETVLLKHSVIISNNTGVENEITSPGKFNSYGDNAINTNQPGGDGNLSSFTSISTR